MSTLTKSFFSAIGLIILLSAGLEAAVKPKSETVTIHTSAICESCKKRIEKSLKATEGVLEASLNLNNKKIKVKYDPAKTSPDKIRQTIANTGYDADDVKKNEAAFDKLPNCCQKPMDEH
ncbi:MAG: heavy-metal-associated domain-containing protein [Bacteroidetes bacterium]|nr:heavy-metal-associated domain-containing protein [Bacteroidota bacterium]